MCRVQHCHDSQESPVYITSHPEIVSRLLWLADRRTDLGLA